VHQLIMATCHAALPTTPDQALLVDIDLSILGADSERFDEYEVQVRQEICLGSGDAVPAQATRNPGRIPGTAADLRNGALPGALRSERARKPATFHRAAQAVAGNLVNSDRSSRSSEIYFGKPIFSSKAA
jgi:hypothetical protein